MTATGTPTLNLAVTETIPGGDGSANAKVEHAIAQFSGVTTTKTFGGATSPSWEDAWSGTVTLSGGTYTLDLTALDRQSPLENVNAAAQKVVAAAFAGDPSNTAGIEVAPDATNGYNIFGTADDKVTVYPGMVLEFASFSQADLAAITDASNDEITFTGSGTEEIHVLLIFGT